MSDIHSMHGVISVEVLSKKIQPGLEKDMDYGLPIENFNSKGDTVVIFLVGNSHDPTPSLQGQLPYHPPILQVPSQALNVSGNPL